MVHKTKAQSKMDNLEKLAMYGAQNAEKQNKNKTQYVLDTTNTNNVNKTLQIIGGKDEPNIVYMRTS